VSGQKLLATPARLPQYRSQAPARFGRWKWLLAVIFMMNAIASRHS
jgi:hypothetical protein